MIDLHLHTTASDGRSAPDELVREAALAGVRTLAVTDHDTVAAVADVRASAAAAGLAFVPGIEITAVASGRDVHVLGYFIDETDIELATFLAAQRRDRRRRVGEMVDRLSDLGVPVRLELPPEGAGGRAVGRPMVAAALVAAGHAADIPDAFARWLSPGRPAFIERHGAPPADVIDRVRRAGGLASLAHPGKLGCDDAIPEWVAAGLAAIEAFHPDHDEHDVARYRNLARDLGVLVTGGSDYHGEGSGRAIALGRVGLPAADYAALASRAEARRP